MAKFIEGADVEMVQNHSSLLEDDGDKIAKNRERKANDTNLPEEKKKAEIYGGRGQDNKRNNDTRGERDNEKDQKNNNKNPNNRNKN